MSLIAASAFATIVGMLGLWKSEAASRTASDIQQFTEWLRRHQHEQLADLILSNAELVRALSQLANQQHDEVIQQLSHLDSVLASVAGRLASFETIAMAVRPESILSEQCVSILSQIDAAGASRIIGLQSRDGTEYVLMDGARGKIRIDEPRFASDDLAVLVELELLRLDFGSQGSNIYTLTRTGSAVARRFL